MDVSSTDTWLGLCEGPLRVGTVGDWAVHPDCGAVVVFTGTVRDRSPGRRGVMALEYEAYEAQVEPCLAAVAEEARRRWPSLGRVALLHRIGTLGVGEAAVAVAVSAPHRSEGFAAARFCIDALKARAPIWKRETWSGGRDWVRKDEGALVAGS